MKLLIVVPALNEEAGIKAIIERCLAARATIVADSQVEHVDITVVSDGSSDRTVDIAGPYAEAGDIQLIAFDRNRGYGAAIKAGWLASDAELLGFIDADGTCDPDFFADLCRQIRDRDVDIMLGSRLSGASRMPLIRRVGNAAFARILSAMSSSPVRDTASGMRVVRRSCLTRLMPLPDGLHFTPAMSARAMLGGDVSIGEIDMPYEERTGDSKLKVVRDGLRFLGVILAAAFLYRPSRLLNAVAVPCAVVVIALMLTPTIHYARYGVVEEWMIYRFVVSDLLAVATVLFLAGAYLASQTVEISLATGAQKSLFSRWVAGFFKSRFFWFVPVCCLFAGGMLVLRSLFSLVPTGRTTEHWSRFVLMSFLYTLALVLSVTRLLDMQIATVRSRLAWLGSAERSLWAPTNSTILHVSDITASEV